jgi:hypothetical protein
MTSTPVPTTNFATRKHKYMIEFTKSYKTTDGQVFSSIEAAQMHEIVLLFNDDKFDATAHNTIAKFLLSKKDALIDIFTTTPNSKPKARAIHGGTKKRTPKVIVPDSNAIMEETINS